MKKSFYLIAFILISVCFGCCAVDDSQDSTMNNHFMIDDTEYDLSKGILINNGPGNGFDGYNMVLFLFSEDLDFTQDENAYIFGSGDRLTFGFTPQSASLDDGDYSFNRLPPFSPSTYRFGSYAIGWGLDKDNDGYLDLTAIDINSGIVSVDKDGDEYEITINCQAVDGKSVTGYYKGSVRYIDKTPNSESAK